MIIAGLVISSIGLFFSMKSLQARDEQKQALERDIKDKPNDEEFGEETERTIANMDNGDVVGEDYSKETQHSTISKIIICVTAAVLCSTLQFAFVFGGELIELAESSDGPGSTPKSGAAAIIWLFVIPLSTISSITHGLYQSRGIPLSNMWHSPISRHLKIFGCACIPWISHIHLYGIAANVLLPPDLAAAVAWPVLMMTTVAWGMGLSIYLGEWKNASAESQKKQKIGLGLSTLGIVVVMATVTL